jgi:uncharacterized membrane protein
MTYRGRAAMTGAAALLTGLLAGLYYSFAVAVIPGLGRLSDAAFADAMNRINEAIVNPVFMLSFLGAPVLSLVALVIARGKGHRTGWLVAGLALNVAGLVVTGAINIPLNNTLLADNNRETFEQAWVIWNVVRTVVTTAALGCLVWAMTPNPAAARSG